MDRTTSAQGRPTRLLPARMSGVAWAAHQGDEDLLAQAMEEVATAYRRQGETLSRLLTDLDRVFVLVRDEDEAPADLLHSALVSWVTAGPTDRGGAA